MRRIKEMKLSQWLTMVRAVDFKAYMEVDGRLYRLRRVMVYEDGNVRPLFAGLATLPIHAGGRVYTLDSSVFVCSGSEALEGRTVCKVTNKDTAQESWIALCTGDDAMEIVSVRPDQSDEAAREVKYTARVGWSNSVG